jgi:hypothetical protein
MTERIVTRVNYHFITREFKAYQEQADIRSTAGRSEAGCGLKETSVHGCDQFVDSFPSALRRRV